MAPGRTASSVGMMEGAFFVSRTELLQWVNTLLQLSLTKVEQCASGAVYCQILDACHPGAVTMKKVNWLAKADHEYIPNYKVLQAAFDKLRIDKNVEVDRLIRAKYQDNLEFLQWMKCYWDREGGDFQEYQPVERREGRPVPPGWSTPAVKMQAGRDPACTSMSGYPGATRAQKENRQPAEPGSTKRPTAGGKSLASPAVRVPPAPRAAVRSAVLHAAAPGGEACDVSFNSSASGRDADMDELKTKMADQRKELDSLQENMLEVQEERDFYFKKLRSVEMFCSAFQAGTTAEFTRLASEQIVEKVLGILYEESSGGAANSVVDPDPSAPEEPISPIC